MAGQPLPAPRSELEAAAALFAGPGEARRALRETDWRASPLGPVAAWPGALRTTVRLALDAPGPALVVWGPERVPLANDRARALLGDAAAPGRPAREGGAEPWPADERVWAGEAVQLADVPFTVRRDGGPQDAWFTVLWTPVRDTDADTDAGGVIGALGTLVETTAHVLARRRLRTLRELALDTTGARSVEDTLSRAVQTLARDAEDVPYALAYRVEGTLARLVAATGVGAGSPLAPSVTRVGQGSPGWPLRQAVGADGLVLVDDVAARFAGADRGGTAPGRAAVVRVTSGGLGPACALVLGLGPRLALDATYASWLDLVAGQVARAVAASTARREERHQAAARAALETARRDLVANLSHEFRTPLTLLLEPLEALARGDHALAPGLAAQLAVAHRSAGRLRALVEALLDLSQLDAGRLELDAVPADLAALTASIADVFAPAAERAGLRLQVDCPPLAQAVRVDPALWEEVVTQLLANAINHTWAGGVTVSVRELRQHAELVVADTGVGIPTDQLPHVLERFHRVPGVRARTHEGAGLGLALVDELVRRHGGRLRVRSREGEGTTLTVWLPLAAPGVAAVAPLPDVGEVARRVVEPLARESGPDPADVHGRAPAGTPRTPGARVLVVDDNADMRRHLVRALDADWAVLAAGDGDEALALARRERPDLVLADARLPGLDGVALLRALRADPALAGTPVILLTAHAEEPAAVEGLLAGADDHVVKPFAARELVARVGAQLELARVRRAADSRFAALARAGWDVVYRMSPDWSELRALDGRGRLVDTTSPTTSWLEEYIDPADRPAVLEAVREAIARRGVFELQHRVRRPDGELGWTLSRAVPVLDDAGAITEWVGVATDVTSSRAAPAGVRTQRPVPGSIGTD